MKKILLSMIMVAMFIVLSVPLLSNSAFANSCGGVPTSILECEEDDGSGSAVFHILNTVVDILTIGVGVLGVLGVTVVGIQYLTAGGSEEKTRKAKNRMLEIIIGLAIYAVFYAVLKWLNVTP